jgi:hypothetical protein
MASANAENSDPQNSNADCGEADNAGEEKKEDQDQENDIVDWEDFGGLDQDPVDGLEDVDVCKYVAAMLLAYGVLCLVDTCDEHAGEDDQRNDDEENTANQLDGPEYYFKLDPSFHEEVLTFSRRLSRQTLAANKCAFFTDQGLELAPIFG